MKEKSVFIVCLALLISVVFSAQTAIAEKYLYNLTETDLNEERILQLCIAEIELEECEMIYGGGNNDGKLD